MKDAERLMIRGTVAELTPQEQANVKTAYFGFKQLLERFPDGEALLALAIIGLEAEGGEFEFFPEDQQETEDNGTHEPQ